MRGAQNRLPSEEKQYLLNKVDHIGRPYRAVLLLVLPRAKAWAVLFTPLRGISRFADLNTSGNLLTLMTKMRQTPPLLPRFFSLYPIRPSLLRIC
jgi:hypothetical protein